MKIALTGHRPHKLNNEYNYKGPLTKAIVEELNKLFDILKPTEIISGMAIGFDTIGAVAAIRRNISVRAAIPCEGQEKLWPSASQSLYRRILEHKLVTPIIVNVGLYADWKMIKRDEWMVDNCNALIACWNGSKGGTGTTVAYATKIGRTIHRINPEELEWQRK